MTPIPVDARSKVRAHGSWLPGIADSNPAGGKGTRFGCGCFV